MAYNLSRAAGNTPASLIDLADRFHLPLSHKNSHFQVFHRKWPIFMDQNCILLFDPALLFEHRDLELLDAFLNIVFGIVVLSNDV